MYVYHDINSGLNIMYTYILSLCIFILYEIKHRLPRVGIYSNLLQLYMVAGSRLHAAASTTNVYIAHLYTRTPFAT